MALVLRMDFYKCALDTAVYEEKDAKGRSIKNDNPRAWSIFHMSPTLMQNKTPPWVFLFEETLHNILMI